MVNIGFTGTQKGMTAHQQAMVELILAVHDYHNLIGSLHHGGCIGADAQFHSMAFKFGKLGYVPIVHPASDVNPSKVAELSPPDAVYMPAKPALVRNHDIVDAVGFMIATPKEQSEVPRSGTWATIRYCKSIGRMVFIIYP